MMKSVYVFQVFLVLSQLYQSNLTQLHISFSINLIFCHFSKIQSILPKQNLVFVSFDYFLAVLGLFWHQDSKMARCFETMTHKLIPTTNSIQQINILTFARFRSQFILQFDIKRTAYYSYETSIMKHTAMFISIRQHHIIISLGYLHS